MSATTPTTRVPRLPKNPSKSLSSEKATDVEPRGTTSLMMTSLHAGPTQLQKKSKGENGAKIQRLAACQPRHRFKEES